MMSYLYTSALSDFFRARRLALWIFVALAMGLMATSWSQWTGDMAPKFQYGQFSSILILRLLALASAIFASAVTSQEVEQKTIVYMLTRPIERWRIILMRMLAAATVVFVICALAAVLASAGIFHGLPTRNPVLGRDLIALAIGSLAYCGLFSLVNLFMNRAMIVCLIFAFGWETAIPNMPGYLYYTSIYSYVSSIADHPVSSTAPQIGFLAGTLGNSAMAPATAWTAMALVCAVCFGLACWWFGHFEFVPREDAE